MLPVHNSKHIEMFTLLYFYTDTRFLLLQTVHLEYHQQRSSRSFILKMYQNRHFWKRKIIKITATKCNIL